MKDEEMTSFFGLLSHMVLAALFGTAVFFTVARPAVAQFIEYDQSSLLVEYAQGVEPTADFVFEPIARTEEKRQVEFGVLSSETEVVEQARVEVREGTLDEAYATLAADPAVRSVQPNIIRRVTLTPDDVDLALQWHLVHETAGISAEAAWDTTIGSTEVVVAVIDTGIDLDHPDLADNIWINADEVAGNGLDDDGNGYVDDVNGYDFMADSSNPNPTPDGIDNDGFAGADTGVTHGTHVAGIIGAVGNNAEGGAGVAWTVKLMALKALDDEGAGTDAAIGEAIRYAADNGAHIINMSLGGYGSTTVLQTAVEYAIAQGVLVIVAAGNDGTSIDDDPFYPTCYEDVLGVASTNSDSEASSFSNFGSCVNVSAPGSSIYSTLFTNDPATGFIDNYGYLSGTSMATPVVSGVAALLKSANSALTDEQMFGIITDTSDDIGLSVDYGTGRVNAASALENIDLANRPSKPGTITAYSGASLQTQLTEATRQKVTAPHFEWEPSTDDGVVAGYYVYFGQDSAANPVTEGDFQTETAFTSSQISGNNASYFLRISAEDDEGNVSSKIASFEYIVDTAVKAPRKVTVSRVPNGLLVEWKKVKNDGVKKYIVFRKVGKKSFTKLAKVSSKLTTYVDKVTRNGETYAYKVRAVDDLKNKQFSKKKQQQFVAQDRIVIAPGAGSGTVVGVYNTKRRIFEETWFAFGGNFPYGVELSVGNMDKDRKEEIVAGVASIGSPQVAVYEANGKQKSSFTAYNPSFTGGVRVAAGDFDNDGQDEIATVPGPGGGPQVKVFETNGALITSFTALDSSSTAGATIAAVNWDGKGADEIVVAPGPGGGAEVMVYNASSGSKLVGFVPYGADFNKGMRVARAKLSKKKAAEAAVVVPQDGQAFVQAFQRSGGAAKQVQPGFYGFVQTYSGGSQISAGDFTQAGADRIVVGSDGGRQSTVQIFTNNGKTLKDTFFPFGGATVPVNIAAGWSF